VEAPGEAGSPGHGYREGRWGNREVEIAAVRVLDDRGHERHIYVPGETVSIALAVRAHEPVDDFVFGFGLFAADGTRVYGTNTDLEEHVAEGLVGDGEVRIVLRDLRLTEGTYLVDVAVHKRDGTPYDYHRGLYSFRVKSRLKDVGIYRPPHAWSFSGGVRIASPEPRPELRLGDDDDEPRP
jgi:hypothetical protein